MGIAFVMIRPRRWHRWAGVWLVVGAYSSIVVVCVATSRYRVYFEFLVIVLTAWGWQKPWATACRRISAPAPSH